MSLTDVNLSGISGLEPACIAIAITKAMKLINSSDYGNFSLDEDEFEAMILAKPYNFDVLDKTLSSITPTVYASSEISLVEMPIQ